MVKILILQKTKNKTQILQQNHPRNQAKKRASGQEKRSVYKSKDFSYLHCLHRILFESAHVLLFTRVLRTRGADRFEELVRKRLRYRALAYVSPAGNGGILNLDSSILLDTTEAGRLNEQDNSASFTRDIRR